MTTEANIPVPLENSLQLKCSCSGRSYVPCLFGNALRPQLLLLSTACSAKQMGLCSTIYGCAWMVNCSSGNMCHGVRPWAHRLLNFACEALAVLTMRLGLLRRGGTELPQLKMNLSWRWAACLMRRCCFRRRVKGSSWHIVGPQDCRNSSGTRNHCFPLAPGASLALTRYLEVGFWAEELRK